MEPRFKSGAAGRHKSCRCSPPPDCGCVHTLAAKKRSSEPWQVTAAPSPCRSQGVPQGHEQKPSFSFWLQPLQRCLVHPQAQVCLFSAVLVRKQEPAPGLGRSHRAAWSLGSLDMIHAAGWVGSKNDEDGLVSFWGVCVKMGCALFLGVLIISKPR